MPLIALESVDCGGKDTLADALQRALSASRINFPCEDRESGHIARSYLQRHWGVTTIGSGLSSPDVAAHLSAFALQAVMLYNRAEALPEIEEALSKGLTVIAVRWWQSGVVYGTMDGLDPESLTTSQRFLPRADLNILLDLPPEVAIARRDARDGEKPPELYEGRIDKIARARALYQELWSKHERVIGGYDPAWRTIDATQSPAMVLADALQMAFRVGIFPK